MIPLWMFPLAIACGNSVILKPSERDPGAAMYIAKLTQEAEFPKGVLNIIHGAHVVFFFSFFFLSSFFPLSFSTYLKNKKKKK